MMRSFGLIFPILKRSLMKKSVRLSSVSMRGSCVTEVDTEEMAIEAAREKERWHCSAKSIACACADDGRRFLDRAVRGNPCPADRYIVVVVSEQGIASGVRRIEAISGLRAASYNEMEGQLVALGRQLKTDPAQLSQRIDAMVRTNDG